MRFTLLLELFLQKRRCDSAVWVQHTHPYTSETLPHSRAHGAFTRSVCCCIFARERGNPILPHHIYVFELLNPRRSIKLPCLGLCQLFEIPSFFVRSCTSCYTVLYYNLLEPFLLLLSCGLQSSSLLAILDPVVLLKQWSIWFQLRTFPPFLGTTNSVLWFNVVRWLEVSDKAKHTWDVH